MADAHSPFDDLNDYVAIPRMTGLRLSPDGSWLAATVQSLSPDKKKYVTSIWRIDTAGGPPAGSPGRPTARAARGSCPTARCCSSSKRPDPSDGATGDGRDAATSRRCGGCPPTAARPAWSSSLPGGVAGVETATGAPAVLLPAGPARRADAAEDEKRRQAQQGRRGLRDLARDAAGALLGSRPRAPTTSRRVRRRRRRGSRAARPDPGRRPGPVRAGGRAQPGRHDGGVRLVAVAGRRAGALGTGHHRRRQRRADRRSPPPTKLTATAARVRLRRPGVRPRRRAHRLRARGARHPGTARRQHPGAVSRRDRPAARVRPVAVGAVLGCRGGHRHLLHRRRHWPQAGVRGRRRQR